ncbi:MAG: molybdopterin-dependent oxidoreductase [Rhizobiaceae bacterium]|nr:molybdopterin-dependent oxidoreductase [Rhizobiaceae bacterium]
METIRRIPNCCHWGAYTLIMRGQEIVSIEPAEGDENPSPILQSVRQWADPSLRVLQPMVREGWLKKREQADGSQRGLEKFVPVSWDMAIDLVASEIQRIRDIHGNASIFAGSYGWASAGRFHHAPTLLKRMLNLCGGFTGHMDTYSLAAGPVILRHTVGSADVCYGLSGTLDTIAQNTRTLVVFGSLTPRTAQNEAGGIANHRLETYLKKVAEQGIRIIVVSPLRDDVPDWLQAEWWPIRPGTDTALMLGLAGEILRAGDADLEFLDRCCSGSERYLAYLEGKGDGVQKNAGWAAGITGLDANLIKSLARNLVQTRSMLMVSWSLQRAQHGEQPFWSALALAAIVGQIGLPGGGVGFGYSAVGGVGAPVSTTRSPAISPLRKALNSAIPVARISDMLLNPGAEYSYQGEIRNYPDTRLVYWAGGNPFHHHQDLNRLTKAWSRPETIIVNEPMWTATAQRADIVLPATTSIERNDIAGNKRMDRMLAMVQAINPLGQAKSDFDIFNLVSERLGVAEMFNEGRDEMMWVRHLYEECRTDAATRLGFEMPDFDRFWEEGAVDLPRNDNLSFLSQFRDDPERFSLKTESGRIVLGSDLLASLNYDDCRAHPAWLEPNEWLGRARDDEFHLISNQPVGRLHSQIDNGVSSKAQKRNGREQVRLNPVDAERLGIEDGSTVRLWNDRGECLATATLDDAVRQQVVTLPTGAWFAPTSNSGLDISGNPNVLTADIPSSSFGQGCAAYTCLVRIEPHATGAPDAISYYQSNIAKLTGSDIERH